MKLKNSCYILLVLALILILAGPELRAVNIGGQVEFNLEYNINESKIIETIKFQPSLRSWIGADIYFESEINLLARGQELDYDIEKLQITYYGLNTDYIIGFQEVNWGAVDGRSPVDNINPRDLRWPVSENNKIPVPAFRMKNYQQTYELDFIWQPVSVPARLPDGQMNSLTQKLLENKITNSTLALRLSHSNPGYDLGASIYRGSSGTPVLVVSETDREAVLKYYLETVLGGEAVIEAGASIIRADIAAAFPESGDYYPDNTIRFAASLERNLTPELFVLAGVQGEKELGAPAEKYLILNSSYQLDFSRNFDFTGIFDIDTGDSLFRPSFNYNVADGINLEAGALIFPGEQNSIGSMNSNNQIYLTTTISF